MARKFVECGPPKELSWPHIMGYIWQKCHICPECGEKTHWPGAAANNCKGSSGTFPIRVNGRPRQVRRLVWEYSGRKLKAGQKIITTCENRRCINPELLKQITMAHIVREALAAGKLNNIEIHRKIAATKLATVGKLTDAQVNEIRSDGRKSPEIAKEYGCSEAYARAIKAGTARRFAAIAANPFFAGLGARS